MITPHPPLRGTFSRRGRRASCRKEKNTVLAYYVSLTKVRVSSSPRDSMVTPHPPLRGTFSRKGRRASCRKEKNTVLAYYASLTKVRGSSSLRDGMITPHPPLRGTFSHKGRRACYQQNRHRARLAATLRLRKESFYVKSDGASTSTDSPSTCNNVLTRCSACVRATWHSRVNLTPCSNA